jgi:hypothetical protein
VKYLQQVASKTLVRDWKLTGSEDATMRRTSREHLLDAVNAVQTERAQPFATVKQRPGGTVNATEYGQNDQDQEEWEEPLVEEDQEEWEEPLVEEANSPTGPNDEGANSPSSTKL